jgi:hypothetical protein
MQGFIDINRKAWDQKVAVHISSDFYDVNGFKQGDTSLDYSLCPCFPDLKKRVE